MVIITVCNSAVLSAAGLALVLLLGTAFRRPNVLIATALMGIPAVISFSLMYGLFGQWQSAAELSIRFAAILSGGLLFFSFVDADELLRAMSLRVPAPVVFILGSITRMRQLAQFRLHTIRQIQQSRGMRVRRFSWKYVLLPLIVGMISDAAERSRPLQRTGIARPGPRTVLYPVNDPFAERVLRWVMVAVTVVLSVWVVL
ncbi:energy-coupling factor transporter transmembrane component T [Corynebacterium gerontici]|nr:energy-coupling factor transporter transmembrane component T [Corynebacterium gerontici]